MTKVNLRQTRLSHVSEIENQQSKPGYEGTFEAIPKN